MQKNAIVFVGEYNLCVEGGSFPLPEEWVQQFVDERCVCVVPDVCGKVRCLNIVPADLMTSEVEQARVVLDSHGRISIGHALLAAVGIVDKVKLVGAVRMIKAFAPEMLEHFREKSATVDPKLDSVIDSIFDGATELSEKSETARQKEEVLKRIADLEMVLATRPKDVEALTELLRLYRETGEETKCDSIMRTLRDIPSPNDIRALAKDFVAAVDGFADGARIEIGKLRNQYAPLFEIVESRQEIRPADIMTATGCGCSFAVEVLKAFARLGMVSKDLSLGLRKVFDCGAFKQMIIRGID